MFASGLETDRIIIEDITIGSFDKMKLIYLIRFPAMTVNELIQCAKPPSLLTGEQIMNLQLYVMEGIFTETLQLFPNIHPRIDCRKKIVQSLVGYNQNSS
ncbi:hypothetical protein DMENIID0001_171040 [Sergentomyia squamirostris]